jgi:Phosphoesterase family
MRRSGTSARLAMLGGGGALALVLAMSLGPSGASGGSKRAGAGGTPSHASFSSSRVSVAPAGTNLIENGGAEVGDSSASGYDAVTIPGWQVALGLPTVVAYGDKGFLDRRTPGPSHRGAQFFAGGAGGTAALVQIVPVRYPGSAPKRVTYHLSGWLGGSGKLHDTAYVRIEFLRAGGGGISTAQIGPVPASARHDVTELVLGRRTGVVPAGTDSIRVSLVLFTTSTDYDGATSMIGYDRGYADNLSLSLSVPVDSPPPLRPPQPKVPRFQHVFLVFMENADFQSIIGNTFEAPYINSLVPQASVLANMYAEVHPSDPNYLALAGGSTFGLVGDVIEYVPRFSIAAKNIGDLVQAAHETWKGYAEGAKGPCDNTSHGYYYLDDLPFVYFRDIRDNLARCRTHLLPLTSLVGNPAHPSQPYDLEKASTTPNFVWFEPDDCFDGESCGFSAADDFLRRTLGKIFRSPAWTTQRSLLIITWDEDGYDLERPAQRIPTLILGSSDVKKGYVSLQRYTHYSLLRTIEAALGLGTMTRNDLYAEPVNDVFG